MNKKWKYRRKGLAAVLLCSLLLTGCNEAVPLMDSQAGRVQSVSAAGSASDTFQAQLLSEDICVIPKKKQSKKDDFFTAGSVLLINDSANKMLYAQNIYKKMYPASITKIVTALIALEQGNLKDKVTISYDASHITEYGAKLCGFQEGDQVTLEDLLYCLLVYSGNDAGIAIAEHISGSVSAFAKLMNQTMAELGAGHSHFVNPHGLQDTSHYTSAYDLYLVFHQLLKYDQFRQIIAQPSYTVQYTDAQGTAKQIAVQSTDRYIIGTAQAPQGVTVMGGKTGTTVDAGSCLILYSQDAKKKDYISVILKAETAYSLYSQMNHLLEYITK